jgi:hypothetical protein
MTADMSNYLKSGAEIERNWQQSRLGKAVRPTKILFLIDQEANRICISTAYSLGHGRSSRACASNLNMNEIL